MMIFLTVSFLFGICIIAFAFSKLFFISILLMIIGGFGMAGFGTLQSILIISAADQKIRGRVLGILAITIGTQPIGAFLLGYYTTILSKHQNKKSNYRFTNNAFSYIILLGVILTYFYWYYSMSKCSDWNSAMTPIIIGGIGGALWSIFIMETNISQLQYFNGISSAEVCSMPTKKMYRCTIR